MVTVRIPERASRHPVVWVSRFKMRWPFFVWLLMIFVVIYLYYHGGRFSSMSGTVESLREQAAPLAVLSPASPRPRPGPRRRAAFCGRP